MSVALLAIALTGQVATPADDHKAALRFLETQPAAVRQAYRFVSCRTLPADQWASARIAVDFTLNLLAALNTSQIVRCEPIEEGRLLVVNWLAYVNALDTASVEAWSNAWENLGQDHPYSRILGEAIVSNGDAEAVDVSHPGPWIPKELHDALAQQTGSIAAILDIGWFCGRAIVAPAYYDFSGIPAKESAFLQRIGVDNAALVSARADRAATVRRSKVTHSPRRIKIARGLHGINYISEDVADIRPETDASRSPLAKIVTDQGNTVVAFRFDAKELVVQGANGLPAFAVFDSAGHRLDAVDPRIATDFSETHEHFDMVVVPAMGCIRCHQKGGLNPFRDYVTKQKLRG